MQASQSSFKPVGDQSRIIHLDILRGIAILFIFLANTASFSGYVVLTPEERAGIMGNGIGSFTSALMTIFIDGKWYSIFSLLFGIGFAIQLDRVIKRGGNFPTFFSRRMLGLLLIGVIHIVFIWMGDILTLYAITGLVLILFRNASNKALLWWSGALILFPIVHDLLLPLTNFYPIELFKIMDAYQAQFGIVGGPVAPEGMPHPFVQYIMIEDVGTYARVTPSNALARIALILFEGRFFKVLGIFLIGLWAGRQILHNDLLNNTKFLKRTLRIGIAIGLPFNLLRWTIDAFLETNIPLPTTIAYALGVVPLAMAYAAGTILLINTGWKFLNIFRAPGKMALTCYLMQSLISIPIYYGIGLGLVGQLPEWMSLTLTLGIFGLQVIFCHLWLKRFKFGPIEWLWRKMTYGKIKLVRRSQPELT